MNEGYQKNIICFQTRYGKTQGTETTLTQILCLTKTLVSRIQVLAVAWFLSKENVGIKKKISYLFAR